MIEFLVSGAFRSALPYLLAAVLGFGSAWKVQEYRLDAAHAEYSELVTKVRAAGEAQNAATAAKNAANLELKRKADAENARSKRDLAALYDAYGRLRDQRPGGSLLPSAPAGTPSPPVASFDRAALDRALSKFDQGVTGLLREGDEAVSDLNTAKRWAQP